MNILFDSGSDRSYISSRVLDKIKPEWVDMENLSFSTFGSTKPTENSMRNIYRLNMKCNDSSYVSIQVTEVPNICTPVSCPVLPDELLRSFDGLSLVDFPSGGESVQIDILIGLDCYWKLVKPSVVSLASGIAAQDTVFGWMLSGLCSGNDCSSGEIVHHPLVCLEYSKPLVEKFGTLKLLAY